MKIKNRAKLIEALEKLVDLVLENKNLTAEQHKILNQCYNKLIDFIEE